MSPCPPLTSTSGRLLLRCGLRLHVVGRCVVGRWLRLHVSEAVSHRSPILRAFAASTFFPTNQLHNRPRCDRPADSKYHTIVAFLPLIMRAYMMNLMSMW